MRGVLMGSMLRRWTLMDTRPRGLCGHGVDNPGSRLKAQDHKRAGGGKRDDLCVSPNTPVTNSEQKTNLSSAES